MEPYYQDESCTIYHGDALSVLPSLPTSSVDALLTDPPYSSGGLYRIDRAGSASNKYDTSGPGFSGDGRDQRSWTAWVGAWSWLALRITKSSGHAFIFSDWRQLPAATDALQLGGWIWRGIVVWDKKWVARPIRGRFHRTSEFVVWGTNGALTEVTDDCPNGIVSGVPERNKLHMAQKPVFVMRHLLRVVPQSPAMILDPFMGAGSTLVAAREAGHKAIGIEMEESYCEIAAKRLSQEVLAV